MERGNNMLKIILMVLFTGIVLFLYSACIVSSRCSREEREYEQIK